LRSSTPARRWAAAHRARRCPSAGIALGEDLREAVKAALGDHLREEQLASTAACSASTPCGTHGERLAADEHPLPGEHEQASS
jgi:hypothetical protein